MKGQLAPEVATSMMWQLIQALKYLHSIGVWHRDIKSSNIFVTYEGGVRIIKLGDFGSARSAEDSNAGALHPADSYQEMDMAMKPSDLYAQVATCNNGNDTAAVDVENDDNGHAMLSDVAPGSEDEQQDPGEPPIASMEISDGEDPRPQTAFSNRSTLTAPASLPSRRHPTPHQHRHQPSAGISHKSSAAGFKAPLTRVVMTPMYRAPEVVMSRGNYTAAIDMWGAGCVFAELLQRVAYVGSASTPSLQVAPLFALRGAPRSSQEYESFGRPDSAGTRRELKALFDVVGTPPWWDMTQVEIPEWRKYLSTLPSRAPTLSRRFKSSGEVAVHLLSRLLDFSPERRAMCEEALAHEFFAELRALLETSQRELAASEEQHINDETVKHKQQQGGKQVADGASAAAEKVVVNTSPGRADEPSSSIVVSADMLLAVDAAAAAATQTLVASVTATVSTEQPAPLRPMHFPAGQSVVFQGDHETEQTRYWEEDNPGRALALLEVELEAAAEQAEQDPGVGGSQRLRALLEAECSAVAAAAATAAAASAAEGKGGTAAKHAPAPRTTTTTNGVRSDGTAMVPKIGSGRALSDMLRRKGPGLQEDTAGPAGRGRDIGAERLSNVADTWQGRELDPRKFLRPARHGEWTEQGGGGGPAPGPRWGVTAAPPGLGADDPRYQAIVKKQQER
jgi:serine/threonine protein kinase